MFKEPPLKICLELEDMLKYQKIHSFKSFLPMEVTVKSWLSKRKVGFLRQQSHNVEILHLVGVEGVSDKLTKIPDLRNLKQLIVDCQFEEYYKNTRIFGYINMLAKWSRKLEVFKVIYNGKFTNMFSGRDNFLEGLRFPILMTELKAVNVDVACLNIIFEQSQIQNLSVVDLEIAKLCYEVSDMSCLLEEHLSNIHLKKLKLHFEGPVEGMYLCVQPMIHLEELETNCLIKTFHRVVPLSVCLPKIKSLKFTSHSSQLPNLEAFVMEGSNYEHLESLTLHGSSLDASVETPVIRAYGRKLLERMRQREFPAIPKLVSLTWKGFSNTISDFVLPKIFASAKHLEELDVSLKHISRLCKQFKKDEDNALGGTNFTRLKTLSIHNEVPINCSKLLYSITSTARVDFKTIKLGENIMVDSYAKTLWEKSGREMIVNPINIVEVGQSQRGNVEIVETFYMDYDLEIDSFVIRSRKTLV